MGLRDSPAALGVVYQIVASLCFALMSCCVYGAHVLSPEASSLQVSLVRSVINLTILLTPALMAPHGLRRILGDGRPALWIRGVFGAGSLIFSFAGTEAIGVAESSFLTASSALFVALMAPWLLRQPNPRSVWVILSLASVGLYLLLEPRFSDGNPLGRLIALASGLCAAIAYLMVAKAGTSNAPTTIIFYFALVSTLMHVVLLPFNTAPWPTDWRYWALSAGAGLAATVAQYYMTRAYQVAPAVVAAIAGYWTPVFGLGLSLMVFAITPDARALLGAGLVVGCGVALPLWQSRLKPASPAQSSPSPQR